MSLEIARIETLCDYCNALEKIGRFDPRIYRDLADSAAQILEKETAEEFVELGSADRKIRHATLEEQYVQYYIPVVLLKTTVPTQNFDCTICTN